jgi:hypothetical protein
MRKKKKIQAGIDLPLPLLPPVVCVLCPVTYLLYYFMTNNTNKYEYFLPIMK